jgi:hypothetical protein
MIFYRTFAANVLKTALARIPAYAISIPCPRLCHRTIPAQGTVSRRKGDTCLFSLVDA